MKLIIGSNSRIIRPFLTGLPRDEFIGVDIRDGLHTDFVFKQAELEVLSDYISGVLRRRNETLSATIFAARQKHDTDGESLFEPDLITNLVLMYDSLISSSVRKGLISNGGKLIFLNSTNSRLISQQNFSYHASCALLDQYAKFVFGKIKEDHGQKLAVYNVIIGLVSYPADGKLAKVSKAFSNAFGDGPRLDINLLGSLLNVFVNDTSFNSGYREVRVGSDQATDPYYSALSVIKNEV